METPGTILRREREAQGLDLREISTITRIPVRSLQHLEEDRFEQFPAEVFVRGFIRNYARELELNTDDVILAYNALKTQRGITASAPRPEPAALRPVTPNTSTPASSKAIARRIAFGRAGGEPRATASPVDTSQRTFRFAYLVVFLVVATSLGLSILFTGTGETREGQRPTRAPIAEGDETQSRWLGAGEETAVTDPIEDAEWREAPPITGFEVDETSELDPDALPSADGAAPAAP